MNKVSIIIPVYNSEKYIGKCLDSIISQTYSNYEIIVVNDGSTDGSKEVIESYTKKYPEKIWFINQENKGVANTRNDCIKRANGKYIMFIDNDDWIDSDYVETFINAIEKDDLDVVIGGYRRPSDTGKIIRNVELKDEEWSKFIVAAPWAKIYKKDYLIKNKIEFLDANIGEDVYFNLKALLLSRAKIKILDYIGYNWFFNTKSLSNSKQKDIRDLQVYELLNNCYDMIKEEGILNKKHDLLEIFFIKYAVWILTFSTKKLKYNIISQEYDKIFKWLEERFPNYKKARIMKISKSKGDDLRVRIFTTVFMLFHKLHLGKAIVWLYSKI